MAGWGISITAAGDYRPTFLLLRDSYDRGRQPARQRVVATRFGAPPTARRSAV
jgi:hypothetical protein